MDELEYTRLKALSLIPKDSIIYDRVKKDTDLVRLKRFIRNDERWSKMNAREKEEDIKQFLKSYDLKHGTEHLKEYDRIQAIWDNTTKELRSK